MMHAVLGWPWWKNKKNELLMLKLAVEEANERQKRKQLAMMEKQRQVSGIIYTVLREHCPTYLNLTACYLRGFEPVSIFTV